MAEVTVYPTGKVKVDRIISVHDVGKAINPLMVEGQIEEPRLAQPFLAVAGDVRIKARFAEIVRQNIGQRAIIFDNEYPGGCHHLLL